MDIQLMSKNCQGDKSYQCQMRNVEYKLTRSVRGELKVEIGDCCDNTQFTLIGLRRVD